MNVVPTINVMKIDHKCNTNHKCNSFYYLITTNVINPLTINVIKFAHKCNKRNNHKCNKA